MITCFDILIKSNGTQWYKFFSTKNCVLTSSAINNSMWKSAVRTEVTRVIVFVGQMPEGKCEGVHSHTTNQCLECWITVDEALQLSLPNVQCKSCTCSRLCGQLPCTSISWLVSYLSAFPPQWIPQKASGLTILSYSFLPRHSESVLAPFSPNAQFKYEK